MAVSCFLFVALAFLVAQASCNDLPLPGETNYDVCILGGGASGTNMAVQLKDRHYNVLVIENQDYLGGHCNTIRFPGGWLDAGVAVFPNTTLANELGFGPWLIDSMAYIQRFAGPNAIVPSQFNTEVPYQGNFATGANFGPYLPQTSSPAFLTALETVSNFALNLYPWIDTMVNVPNPIPAELLVPLTEWVETNNLEDIYIILNGTLWIGGYGNFTQMRAIDGIAQALGGTSLLYDIHPGSWISVNNGCQSIYDGITDYLGPNSISLNTQINVAYRPPAGFNLPSVLVGTKNNLPFHAVCDQVVVSFQQTPEAIAFLFPDLAESAVFAGVTVIDTTVAQVNVAGPIANDPTGENLGFTLFNTKVNPPLNQPAIPTLLGVQRALTFGPGCANGFSQTLLPQGELEQIMRNAARGISPELLTEVEFVKFWEHVYSPRFPTSSLKAHVNAYLQLDALQGHRNTYWVGSIRTTENSVTNWNYNTVLVNAHFPPK